MPPTSSSPLNQLAQQEKMRREVMHKSDLIPPLPDLVVRLLSVLNRQETEPQDLERLMQNDQVLVAKMLAMVNSPLYGLNCSIRTIKEAVMVLGFRGVRSLVLATSTAKFMQRDFSCYGHQPKGLWLHAACVAAASKALAKSCKLGQDTAEMLFVSGLMHDIGKLMLVQYLAPHQQTAPTKTTVTWEREKIGIDHTEAGALVTAKWNLAPEIQDVIKAHHDEPSDSTEKLGAIVRLADAVAHERGIGYLPGRTPDVSASAADLNVLGISASAWIDVRADLAVAMDEAIASLGNIAS